MADGDISTCRCHAAAAPAELPRVSRVRVVTTHVISLHVSATTHLEASGTQGQVMLHMAGDPFLMLLQVLRRSCPPYDSCFGHTSTRCDPLATCSRQLHQHPLAPTLTPPACVQPLAAVITRQNPNTAALSSEALALTRAKCADSLWKFSVYLFFSLYELRVASQASWFSDSSLLFANWPHWTHSCVSTLQPPYAPTCDV